ncbi:MAG: NAD-dependent epimerase/dehydratase family protein [Candidatus Omnitrophota bacterium]
MTKTLLVTGAAGFIGPFFIAHAIKKGYRIIIVDLKEPVYAKKSGRVIFIPCDLSNPRDLKKLEKINSPLNLVHMGAFVPHVPSQEEMFIKKIFAVNLKGTMDLLDVLGDRIEKAYYVSTLEVYGLPRYLPIDEKHPANPVSFYGISKLYAEKYLSLFCQAKNIPYAILRLSCIYGPGEEYARAIPNFIKEALSNQSIKIYGNGQDKRDYLYVDDAAGALLNSVENDIRGICNIVSGRSYKIIDVAKRIVKLSGSKSKITLLPRKKKLYDLIFDASSIKRLLKFKPETSIEEGLEREISWCRKMS